MADDVIRVVLADDHAVVRVGLRAVLGAAKDVEIVGEARTGRDAVNMAQRLSPDVVVMDLDMPDLDGAGALREIVQLGLPCRVLILSMHPEEDRLVPLIQAGAAGYLVKSAADVELVDAIRAVAHGDVYVRGSAARLLARTLNKRDLASEDRQRFEQLTQREQDVLRLVALGYSAPEIGGKLFISPKTVDTYKQRIQEKVGLAHRSEYIQFSLRLGLMTVT